MKINDTKLAYQENSKLIPEAKEALRKSIEMWETVKKDKTRRKLDYFVHYGVEDIPLNRCYLCEFVKRVTEGTLSYGDCVEFCPVANWSQTLVPYHAKVCYSCMSVYADYADCPANYNDYDAFAVADGIIRVLTKTLKDMEECENGRND